MPHISKGGKYIFGWSTSSANGRVSIPAEALAEYHLRPGDPLILISGSKTSGGFLVAKKSSLAESEISGILQNNPELAYLQIAEGKTVKFKGRHYCWIRLRDHGQIVLPPHTRQKFEVKSGDNLLVIRGSNIAFVMAIRGPIIEKAKSHPEIKVCE